MAEKMVAWRSRDQLDSLEHEELGRLFLEGKESNLRQVLGTKS